MSGSAANSRSIVYAARREPRAGEKNLGATMLFAVLSMSLVNEIAHSLVACTLAADVREDASRLYDFFLQYF